MFNHHISGMASAVAQALALTDEQAAKAEKALLGFWDRRGVAIIWNVSDVQSAAVEGGLKRLKVAEAKHVLSEIHRNHDSAVGVSWDTILGAIRYLGYARQRAASAPATKDAK